MNALELADRLTPERPTVLRVDAEHAGEMLRAQHEAIRVLREALSVLVENGGIGPEQMFDDARNALAATETLT